MKENIKALKANITPEQVRQFNDAYYINETRKSITQHLTATETDQMLDPHYTDLIDFAYDLTASDGAEAVTSHSICRKSDHTTVIPEATFEELLEFTSNL